jgi:hypothetical protein
MRGSLRAATIGLGRSFPQLLDYPSILLLEADTRLDAWGDFYISVTHPEHLAKVRE